MDDENEKKKPRRSVLLVQIGNAGYRVERTTNFLEQRVNVIVPMETAQQWISEGITVNVARNK